MTKAVRRMTRRGKDMAKLDAVIEMLADRKTLPPRYRDHALQGSMYGRRECHIEPDWLLIYRIVKDELVLIAVDTGTHAEVFGR